MPKFKPVILDEDCAPRRVLELFSVKWTTMVLHSLHFNGGTCRTGVLARSLPGCSKKMLTHERAWTGEFAPEKPYDPRILL